MPVAETDTKTCSALIASGRRCLRPPGASGLCSVHARKLKPNPAQVKYQQIVKAVLDACRIKGWGAILATKDKNYHLATIEVWKSLSIDHVTGLFHVAVDGGVKYRIEKTSFHGYGLNDLLDAISFKFEELGWLKKSGSKTDSEQRQAAETERIKQQELNTVQMIKTIIRNFDKVARQLRRRYNDRSPYDVSDEYDVQDLLHAILRAYFDDVRPEEHTPSYAGASSRVDFMLKTQKAVIEVKFATTRLRDKQIGEQLIIDIASYQAHPDCTALYCLVYDPLGNIHNPAGLQSDLSRTHDKLAVTVTVVPN